MTTYLSHDAGLLYQRVEFVGESLLTNHADHTVHNPAVLEIEESWNGMNGILGGKARVGHYVQLAYLGLS